MFPKKRGRDVCPPKAYLRLLRITATAATTAMITTAAMPAKSAVLGPPVGFSGVEGDVLGVAVAVGGAVVVGGVGVVICGEGAVPATTYAVAYESPYEAVPANVAMIWYVPAFVGVHAYPKVPPMSLVAVPSIVDLPSGSTTEIITSTPLAVVGIGFCWCK